MLFKFGMLEWSTKRKLIYLGAILGVIFLFVVLPLIFSFYEKPTCFDGDKNQNESGVDCGGSCEKICDFEVIDPVVSWSRVFKISDNVWSAMAYVENPNINAKTESINYVFRLRDSSGNLLMEREGSTFIPNKRVVAIFEPNLRPESGVPARADFEFLGKGEWKKDSMPPLEISIRNQRLSRLEDSPRLEAELENQSLVNIPRLEVAAIIFDGEGNALGASRTFVDNFSRGTLRDIVFTWPIPFPVQEKVCKVPVDISLIIDRSGSMAAESLDPPEPLNSVKEAANFFIDNVNDKDQISLVSFATEASLDSNLSTEKSFVKQAVNDISILFSEGTQYTNISESLDKAIGELNSERQREEAERVIVLLTDGEVPNRPLNLEGQQDDEFASGLAMQFANQAKSGGVEIYTIGLGQQFDGSFLKTISTTPEHFYSAPSAQDLKGIYENIANEICKEGPTTAEIITRSHLSF